MDGKAFSMAVANRLNQLQAQSPPGVQHQFGAGLNVDWRQKLSALDGLVSKYLPTLGPLAPAQFQALAALVAEAIHLANTQVNG